MHHRYDAVSDKAADSFIPLGFFSYVLPLLIREWQLVKVFDAAVCRLEPVE